LFSEGDNRSKSRPVYEAKEEANNWGWGEQSSTTENDTVSELFAQINNGTFDPTKRKRKSSVDLNPYDRIVERPKSNTETDSEDSSGDDESGVHLNELESSSVVPHSPARGECIMSTAEALLRLTQHDKEDDGESEWLIIKVPKKIKHDKFLVDYVDGDTEDEFQWLEGPHSQTHTTIADLLDRRRSQPRKVRRRQGHTEFRDEEEIDRVDPLGKRLENVGSNTSIKEDEKGVLVEDSEEEDEKEKIRLKKEKRTRELIELMGTSPKREERSPSPKRNKDEDDGSSILMTMEDKEMDITPLHDLTYVGIDTCSARSISCDPEDFLDLRLFPMGKRGNELRGVGGASGVAGKGTLVFFAKDIDGRIKAIIEPKGFYLDDAPAKFRIIGQQKMKRKGINLVQDYDNEGTDILKCKRSGAILPLEEKGKILLLKTFK
jgi:hypothetical protein